MTEIYSHQRERERESKKERETKVFKRLRESLIEHFGLVYNYLPTYLGIEASVHNLSECTYIGQRTGDQS